MIVVLCALLGSLSVLPALLHKLGDRVDSGRVPYFHRRRGAGSFLDGRRQAVLRRPVISVVLSTGAAGRARAAGAAAPHEAAELHGLPEGPADRAGVQDVQRAFPGSQTPVVLVVRGDRTSTTPQFRRAYAAFRSARGRDGRVLPAVPRLRQSRQDGRARRVLDRRQGRRQGVEPRARRRCETTSSRRSPAGCRTPSGRSPAPPPARHDFNERMKQRMPIVFAFVLGLAFVLMLLAFRSIVIPIKTVAAQPALGLGGLRHPRRRLPATWARALFGFTSNGAITSWLPLFLFVILFGLSMDYHVFILSRVKERSTRASRPRTRSRIAISRRPARSRAPRSSWSPCSRCSRALRLLPIKQLGFGLAVAVFLDATVVRAVLLPAAMKLLGEWNWYLPRWLRVAAVARGGGQGASSASAAGRASRISECLSLNEVTQLALELGAEARDLDALQYHPNGGAWPPNMQGYSIPETTRAYGAVLLNADGEEFTDSLGPRDVVSQAIFDEVDEGQRRRDARRPPRGLPRHDAHLRRPTPSLAAVHAAPLPRRGHRPARARGSSPTPSSTTRTAAS